MIPQHIVDQIFSASIIEEVVADYVTLKKRGANMLGLCPFHNEKTPSFMVSPAKGIYKCFGCGRAGNVVGFLMEHEGMGYVDALKNLATRYHIEIEEDHSNREQLNEKARERESLLVALEHARKYFLENLDTDEGKNIARTYLNERGLSEKTIQDFSLGYAMNQWRALLEEMTSKGFDRDVLFKAGLIKQKEGSEGTEDGDFYDAFRERIMFPIKNISGKVVGYGGRQLRQSEKSPKYINSPETAVYNKSNILYGLDLAKNEIRKSDSCYLVEGYMDVVSLYQSGIQNVVASSGTSLTEGQVRQVKRFGQNIVILYDGDTAGIQAAMRAIDLILQEGLNVYAVTFPEGEDPDSYCQKHGASGLEQYVEDNRLDFIRFKAKHTEGGDLKDPIKRTNIARTILESIAKIADPIKRSAFLVETARFMDMDEQILRSESLRLRNNLRKAEAKKIERNMHVEWREDPMARALNTQQESKSPAETRSREREQALMRLLVLYGFKPYDEDVNVAEFVVENLIEDEYHFHSDRLKKIVESLTEVLNEEVETEVEDDENAPELSEDYFVTHPEFSSLAAHYIAHHEVLSKYWSEKHDIFVTDEDDNYAQTTYETMNYIKLSHLERSIENNKESLKSTEEEDSETQTQLLKIHQKLDEIRKKLVDEIGISGADK